MQTHRTATTIMLSIIAALTIAASAAANWKQVPGPVLAPTLPWEARSVSEPTVFWDKDRYRLWYTGGWETCYVGYAESLDGVHWAKWNKPVLAHACHSSVARTSHGFDIYSATEDARSLQVTRSSDGIHMNTKPRTIMKLAPTSWDSNYFANTYAWTDSNGKRRILYEGRKTGWQIGSSTFRKTGWIDHTATFMPLGFGGTAGGPWLDHGCLYFHASPSATQDLLPTSIYRRCGPLNHLGPAKLVIGRSQAWEVDQVADPSIARRPGHRPLLLFSGMDNPNAAGGIGAAFER